VSWFRKEVIDFALGQETLGHITEQREWIAREPANPVPYLNLAKLYRMDGRQREALGVLLEAVRLNPDYAEAHLELAEIYIVHGDNSAAWRHGREAERQGENRAVALLRRYHVPES
jgi:cytochrome c-type biogenesis protein CcmH/NrfG